MSGWKPEPGRSRHPAVGRPLRLSAILLLATALTACGWKLRGDYSLPPEITPIAVEGGGIAGELRESLRNSDALAEASDESAASRVEILEENEGRRVLSVDLDGKVDEYEVRYEVRWQLTAEGSGDKSRRILVSPTTFRANRSYDYSASTELSTSEQEKRLVENMRDDIVQRILFRLQAVDADEAESDRKDDEDERDSG
ncbi:MAG: LPS assembly lipoprotein LptE [Halofilum sp. (in: g-proteobacteria)]